MFPAFSPTIDVGNLITIIVTLVGLYRFSIGQAKSQALRDQKIDIVLFGPDGTKGMVKDIEDLKSDHVVIFDSLGKLGFNRRNGEDRRQTPDHH